MYIYICIHIHVYIHLYRYVYTFTYHTLDLRNLDDQNLWEFVGLPSVLKYGQGARSSAVKSTKRVRLVLSSQPQGGGFSDN